MQRPRFSEVSILVVDDDDVNRFITTKMLRALGCANITTARDGQEAVTACRDTSFDLVVMDCDMPVLNGLDATRALRAAGFTAPVIAFTATTAPAHKDRCLEAGMTDFLPKPSDLAAMSAMLQRWLSIVP